VRTRLSLLVAVAIAVSAAGVASAASHAWRSTVTVKPSSFGRILFDGRGFALYSFTRDPPGHSACKGECAKRWPPFLVNGRARAASGVKSSLLGTTRRADGKTQVTYAGHPLYYYVGDRKAGQVLCQNVNEFGGTWLVVRASGKVVR
jgi:predicted lipoprotein with Yx(FWY)xxD motif